MQWMDDSSLTKAFENPFVETGAFKGCSQDIYTGCWADEDRERVMKKYEDILLEKLGWNSPQMWMMTITSKAKSKTRFVFTTTKTQKRRSTIGCTLDFIGRSTGVNYQK